MNFAFSTLGLPGAPLDTVVDLARSSGYTGLELRCAEDEPVHTNLNNAERRTVARALRRAHVTPVALASYIQLAAPGDDGPVLAELRRHIWLAGDIGAHYVRVFPGGGPKPGAEADRRAVRRLTAVADLAAACGVRIALETHDSHARARDVARVLAQVGSPGVCAIWDTLHTHLAGDPPQAAAEELAPYLGYVQVKDIAGPHNLTPLPLGSGTSSLGPTLDCLRQAHYRGWLVWEYEARWHPHALPLPPLLSTGRVWLEAALGRCQPHGAQLADRIAR
ncbi:sugar phosphate isomerase/epimerase family protein [Streptacidiphilus sp. MAP5-52]|uniref:sugar phosphate isomerase/epimerase family protein n=1 Tax=Streptacidiphilus sp. MAP5-52 TaxID=3156267 RepID=UPI0035156FFD